MLLMKKLFFKIMLFKKNFILKIVLFNIARRTQNLLILRGKLMQNAIFCVQIFFKIVLFEKRNFHQNRAF